METHTIKTEGNDVNSTGNIGGIISSKGINRIGGFGSIDHGISGIRSASEVRGILSAGEIEIALENSMEHPVSGSASCASSFAAEIAGVNPAFMTVIRDSEGVYRSLFGEKLCEADVLANCSRIGCDLPPTHLKHKEFWLANDSYEIPALVSLLLAKEYKKFTPDPWNKRILSVEDLKEIVKSMNLIPGDAAMIISDIERKGFSSLLNLDPEFYLDERGNLFILVAHDNLKWAWVGKNGERPRSMGRILKKKPNGQSVLVLVRNKFKVDKNDPASLYGMSLLGKRPSAPRSNPTGFRKDLEIITSNNLISIRPYVGNQGQLLMTARNSGSAVIEVNGTYFLVNKESSPRIESLAKKHNCQCIMRELEGVATLLVS